jgi:hypothetical protein
MAAPSIITHFSEFFRITSKRLVMRHSSTIAKTGADSNHVDCQSRVLTDQVRALVGNIYRFAEALWFFYGLSKCLLFIRFFLSFYTYIQWLVAENSK